MCVTSLPWNGFLSLYKVYQGWGLQRSGPKDPPKENGRKFAPTAPNSIRDPSSRSICTEGDPERQNIARIDNP